MTAPAAGVAAGRAAGRATGIPPVGVARWRSSAALLGGLAAIVLARWAAARAGLDPLAVGAGFGVALLAVATVPWPVRMERARLAVAARRVVPDLGLGIAAGLGLVALAMIGVALAGASLVPGLGRPAVPFAPWALITIVVATAEEVLLRGRLFAAVRAAGGVGTAVAVTTVAFALMHVPLYGWHVVPLDVGVGLVLAGIRLGTGRIAAPAAAHAVADLATWWL
jgi:membrane protease YdiL (CAAX protease family)